MTFTSVASTATGHGWAQLAGTVVSILSSDPACKNVERQVHILHACNKSDATTVLRSTKKLKLILSRSHFPPRFCGICRYYHSSLSQFKSCAVPVFILAVCIS